MLKVGYKLSSEEFPAPDLVRQDQEGFFEVYEREILPRFQGGGRARSARARKPAAAQKATARKRPAARARGERARDGRAGRAKAARVR